MKHKEYSADEKERMIDGHSFHAIISTKSTSTTFRVSRFTAAAPPSPKGETTDHCGVYHQPTYFKSSALVRGNTERQRIIVSHA